MKVSRKSEVELLGAKILLSKSKSLNLLKQVNGELEKFSKKYKFVVNKGGKK